MKAVVLAGGLGSRLYPLTTEHPKPMLKPLGYHPVLAYILGLLKRHNFSEVVITVHYMADQIRNYFGDGSSFGMRIDYALETKPLGTAGGVKNVQPYLDHTPFLVISGDLITDIDLTYLLAFHRRKRALATLALTQVENPQGYGVVITDWEGRIKQFVEKPGSGLLISRLVNTGIYVLEPEILDMMEPERAYDFSCDLFPLLVRQNRPFYGSMADGYWCDMGTLETYEQAAIDMFLGKVNLATPDYTAWSRDGHLDRRALLFQRDGACPELSRRISLAALLTKP
jgi:mannose-1-phosphate guanylyltransferase/phosphomannomutase